MKSAKRVLSLVLAAIMMLSVMSAGFITAGAANVPVVPRNADVMPNATFNVPGYLTTYGTNQYVPGTKVNPITKGVSFYLNGATNISLSTTSNVSFGTRYTVGSTYYWDITGGSATSGNYVEFTVSYLYQSKTYTTKAYSYVLGCTNDATIVNRHVQKKTAVARNAYGYHAFWISPTQGKFEGYIPTLVTSGSGSGYFIPESKSFEYDASGSASAFWWHRNDSSGSSTDYTLDAQYSPSGYYYVDVAEHSNLSQTALKINVLPYDGDLDSNHKRTLQNVAVENATLNGTSTTGYSTSFDSGFDMSKDTLYTYTLSGAIPSAGSTLELNVLCQVKAQAKNFMASASMTLKEYIKLKVVTYDKSTLRSLINQEKTNNRQSQYFNIISWELYEEAYAQAYSVLGKPNTTQAEINSARSNLQSRINTLTYNDADYSGINFLLATLPTDYLNNPEYYTTQTKQALDLAISDIEYDRTLDMRYQNAVNQMKTNLDNAIANLTYNEYSITFNTNGGTSMAPITVQMYENVNYPIATTQKVNHTFVHWCLDEALQNPVNWPITMPYGGMTLYAKWSLNSSTISFDSMGGSAVPSQEEIIGTSCYAPIPPTKTGFNFDGWYYSKQFVNPVSWPIIVPSTDVTFYAKWSAADFTITFNSNGGSPVGSITDSYGSAIQMPNTPTKTGANFLGWCYDSGLSQAVTWPLSMPAENITLYAKWTTNYYTITFDSDGGTPVAPLDVEFGYPINAPTPPTKEGYTFDCWTYENTGVEFNFNTIMPANNFMLKAKWAPKDITIFLNTGEGASPVAPITQKCGTVVAEPIEPTKDGYLFVGWLLNGELYEFTVMPTVSISLTADWIIMPDLATVKLNTSLGSGAILEQGDIIDVTLSLQTNYYAGSSSFLIVYDKRYFEPAKNGMAYTQTDIGPNFTANGFASSVENFDSSSTEWNYWETGKIDGRVNPESSYNYTSLFPFNWLSTPSYTLKPEYENYSYVHVSVTVNVASASGGTLITIDDPQDIITFQLRVKDDAPITTGAEHAKIFIPEDSIKRSDNMYVANNKTFVYNVPGNHISYGTGVFNDTVYRLNNADLSYNIIERQPRPEYTITFDSAGGSSVSSITQEMESFVIEPPTPTRTNYDFTGWTYNGTLVTWPFEMPGGNITLVAQWVRTTAEYTVYHYLQNILATGFNLSSDHTQVLEGNVAAIITATPLNIDGFTYSVGESISSGKVTSDGGLQLHLYYTRNSYKIEFDTNGGTAVDAIIKKYAAPITAPEPPTKIGHSFIGWSPGFPDTMPSENIALVAQWAVNNYSLYFYINGSSEPIYTITQAYGSNVTAPVPEVPGGYEFSGWDSVVPTIMPALDQNFYGEISLIGYKVFYYINNQLVETQTYQDGDTVIPYMPDVEVGYKFSGWDPQLPQSMGTEDVHTYGTISRVRYTLSYYLNGMAISEVKGYYADPVTAPNVDVPPGYEFSGWDKNYQTMPAHDDEIHGTLSRAEYSVNFYINGNLVKTVTGPEGTSVTPPATAQEGYTFSGWIPAAPSVISENVDCYGTLTINSYNVVFKIDNQVVSSETLEYGSNIVLPEVTVPEGYSFSGWTPGVDATVPANNVEYNGYFEANEYTLTFNINGELHALITGYYGENITIPEFVVPNYHTFSGWDGVPATIPAENMVFNATLTADVTTISFDLNGGTGTNPADITDVIGAAVSLPEQGDIVKEGYLFLGWAESAEATEALESYAIPVDATILYAVWESDIEPEIIASEDSGAIVDNERGFIYGLKVGITSSELSDYITNTGDTSIIIESNGATLGIGTGTKVILIDNATQEEIASYYIIIFGDVDGDGKITSGDTTKALQYVAKIIDAQEGSPYVFAANLDGFGDITSNDATKLNSAVGRMSTIDQTTGLCID